MDDDDKPTPAPTPAPPEPPAPTPPEPPAPTPPEPPSNNDGPNARLDRLENIVTTLTDTVSKLIPSDDKPTRGVPWTHFGSRKRDS